MSREWMPNHIQIAAVKRLNAVLVRRQPTKVLEVGGTRFYTVIGNSNIPDWITVMALGSYEEHFWHICMQSHQSIAPPGYGEAGPRRRHVMLHT